MKSDSDVIQVFWYSKIEENYFSYYLLKVIENDMRYMLQEKKKVNFFLNAISLAVYSFVIHSPPARCEGLLL